MKMGRKPTRKTKAFKALRWYASRGLSANEIQRRLQKRNLGIRRKRILEEVRIVKDVKVKSGRYKYIRKKYRPKDYIPVGKQKYLFRCSLILNDVPVHSKPFKRNYLGFRINAFSTNEKKLRAVMGKLRELLIDLVEQYLGYPSSEWWFSHSTYIGYEYPRLIPVYNPEFLNGKWIFRIEREGREIRAKSGRL